MTSIVRKPLTFAAHERPAVGDIKMSALGIDHLGWLVCDGRQLNVSDYKFLFNVIGYQFGGSGGQFRLPDPAGRVPGIVGTGTGLEPRAMGDASGEEYHTLTIAEMPTHNHGITDPGHRHDITDLGHNHTLPFSGAALTGVGPSDDVTQGGAAFTSGTNTTGISVNVSTTGITINNTGGSNAHNNMQPTLFVGNMFMYSGKPRVGNYPFTAGYYGIPPANDRYSNVQ